MTDECIQWVIPAISLGFSVCNDPDGKLKFWTDSVEIIYRCDSWIAIDGIDPNREYLDIKTALQQEA